MMHDYMVVGEFLNSLKVNLEVKSDSPLTSPNPAFSQFNVCSFRHIYTCIYFYSSGFLNLASMRSDCTAQYHSFFI